MLPPITKNNRKTTDPTGIEKSSTVVVGWRPFYSCVLSKHRQIAQTAVFCIKRKMNPPTLSA